MTDEPRHNVPPHERRPDISEWGEKDTVGAYAPGTTFHLGDGEPVRLDELPDYLSDDAA